MNHAHYRCRVCGGTTSSTETSGIKDWEFGIGGTYEYRRCTTCNQIQLHPFPTIGELEAAYPETYSSHVSEARSRGLTYNALSYLASAGLQRQLRRYVRRGARVLDVGCGNGEFLVRLKELGAQVLEGIDFSEKAARLASDKGITVFRGLFVDFPALDASYDAVFMNNYIEHVLEPMPELRKAKRLLRPDGVLVGEVPNFGSLDRKIFGRYWGGNHVPRHTFQYDRAQLTRLLSDAGFRKVMLSSELNTGTIAASIQNYLQRNAPSLQDNPNLTYGRMPGFDMLLIAAIPFNLIPTLLRRSGVVKFIAVA